MTTTLEEAERLARTLSNECHLDEEQCEAIEPSFRHDIRRLCDFILSGDMKREAQREALLGAAVELDEWAQAATNVGSKNGIINGYRSAAVAVRELANAFIPAAPAKEPKP